MSVSEDKGPSGAKLPDTKLLEEYELLMACCECWQSARKGKILPTKRDFEGAVLAYPELLPFMSVLEVKSKEEIKYIYLGSDMVFQRNKDQTREEMAEAMSPGTRKFAQAWVTAAISSPFLAFWVSRSHLDSGLGIVNHGLSVVLSDQSGQPSYIVAVNVGDEAHRKTLEQRGYQLGVDGVDITPIDIGFGVPDLPRKSK